MSGIGILGSGGWGLALALTALYNGNNVVVWTPFETEAETLNREHEHKKLLPGVVIPESVTVTTDLNALDGLNLIITAVPSVALRGTARRLRGIRCDVVVNVAKGFEKGSCKRLSEVLSEELPGRRVVVLSGPSHAEEVARRIPTAIAAASTDGDAAAEVQKELNCDFLRIYRNDDLIGVELGGALKNVIAVAAGFLDGAGFGDNTKAALITRGLAEMARLGTAMGGKETTFMGLTGLGDLVVTCTSPHSRNHRFGVLVGQGVNVKEALSMVGTVEGYYAAEAGHTLAERFDVAMPILNECYTILYDNGNLYESIDRLMRRNVGEERRDCR